MRPKRFAGTTGGAAVEPVEGAAAEGALSEKGELEFEAAAEVAEAEADKGPTLLLPSLAPFADWLLAGWLMALAFDWVLRCRTK